MAKAVVKSYPGVRYFRKRRGGKGFVGLGRDVQVKYNARLGKKLCMQRVGGKLRLATKRPCYRLSVSQGRLIPVDAKNAAKRGFMITVRGKPDDPRKVWKQGRWQTKTSLRPEQLQRFRKYHGVWYSGPRRRYAYVDFRWWPAKKVTRGMVDRLYRNNPYMKWNAERHEWTCLNRKHPWWRRNGLWRSHRGSRVVYLAGRWMDMKKARAIDPHFQLRGKSWVYNSPAFTRYFQTPSGRWLRHRGSRFGYSHSRWMDVTRNPRWVRVCPRGNGGASSRGNPCFYDVPHRGVKGKFTMDSRGVFWKIGAGGRRFAYLNGQWVPYDRAMRQISSIQGQWVNRYAKLIPKDVRDDVDAQVKRNVFRFLKWFISNYMRGGQLAKPTFLARRIVPASNPLAVSKFNPASPSLGVNTLPSEDENIIDGLTRDMALRLIQHAKKLSN
jgi:hypothetical protein